MSTPYHAKYFAHELTKKCSSRELAKLNQSIFNATVDLNPHQIDAALFAFRSPLSRGALLADEVGLGKTIEAGLIMSQLWAERKRRILCILPAALRPQWSQELLEKFFIDSIIIESASYNQFLKQGMKNPFDQENRVVLCSYQFARSKEHEVRSVLWDLVVVDEAHRLRNVYKKSNKIARAIRDAIGSRPKVLLTATPLQNSLLELYGLISFIDPHLFGSEETFREQFARNANEMGAPEFNELRERIRPICQRTLRRQVLEYIRYTNRVSITQDFTPTDDELQLYQAVSEYLQRPDSYALPARQRSLMTLVLRKILASSSFAIAATLGSLLARLEEMHKSKGGKPEPNPFVEFGNDFETVNELQEEWEEDADDAPKAFSNNGGSIPDEEATQILNAIRKEADELKNYRDLAESIAQNAKGEALLIALKTGFKKAADLGAPPKALIFTESRRTQQYLFELLAANGYGGEVVTFNGTNNEPQCKEIYKNWRERHQGDDAISGSPSADMRSALVEEFRDRAAIMIATESGAEGVNLQFCSLVVNYDLPWNPQRIEQRIGRCHRYGQEHDVVVINFLNRENAADQRVFELLREKLHLFDGVFGTSDEVLGALESGVDFERRINDIYQSCRTPDEINTAFDRLQADLDGQIRSRMEDTRAKLFEHFDADVHRRLRSNRDETAQQMSRFEDWLWRLAEFELKDDATFGISEDYMFHLNRLPDGLDADGIPLGEYRLVTKKSEALVHQYRTGHPLAERLITRAKGRALPCREIIFRYDRHPKSKKITLVENLQGKSGWLRLYLLSLEALEREDHLVFIGMSDDGTVLDAETCEKFFVVDGSAGDEATPANIIQAQIEQNLQVAQSRIVTETAEHNRAYFDEESEKLENWAEDLKGNMEQELKSLDREIKAMKKEARQCAELNKKIELHKQAKALERKRNDKRRSLFEAQDEIDQRKDELIDKTEARLQQHLELVEVFTIRWRVI